MLRVNQIKLKYNHSDKDLTKVVHKALNLSKNDNCEYRIFKKSIDARHKPEIMAVYSVDILSVKHDGKVQEESRVLKKCKNKNVVQVKEYLYTFPVKRDVNIELKEEDRPVIIGFGPAGMFVALKLAQAGLRPIVYERGKCVDERKISVDTFWQGGKLDTECNVQFGEGGAGTFSDGKLNTMIKDPTGRIREVLKTFVEYGADSSIMYINKPHIGTDVLSEVVKNIRNKIISLGGEVIFNSRLDDIVIHDGQLHELVIHNVLTNENTTRKCHNVCLAIGHSARDTFYMLNKNGFDMQSKPFAVGMRLEHPQEFIDYNAYVGANYKLPAADYKVTYQTSKQRGVYSFCM